MLFSLLLSSGAGSLSTAHVQIGDGTSRGAVIRLGLLLIVLIAFGVLTPAAIRAFEASSTPVRIFVSVGTLVPLGFFMGMAFPIGMGRALRDVPALSPWLWAVNGSASVCASVLAVVIALGAGISASFWTGALCYGAAMAALVWGASRELHGEGSTVQFTHLGS